MLMNENETVIAAVVYGLKKNGMSEAAASQMALQNLGGWLTYARACTKVFGFTETQSWQFALNQVREAAKKGAIAPNSPPASPLPPPRP